MIRLSQLVDVNMLVKRKPLTKLRFLSEGLCLCGCKRSNTLIQLVKETEQYNFSWKETFSFLVSMKYVMCEGVFIGIVAFIKTNLPGRDGTVVREPSSTGFDSRTRRHKWVGFVGSLLCFERFFSWYSGCPLSPKTNI